MAFSSVVLLHCCCSSSVAGNCNWSEIGSSDFASWLLTYYAHMLLTCFNRSNLPVLPALAWLFRLRELLAVLAGYHAVTII